MTGQLKTIRVNSAYLHAMLAPVQRWTMLRDDDDNYDCKNDCENDSDDDDDDGMALLDLRSALHRQMFVEEIVVPLFDQLAVPARDQARQALKYYVNVNPGPKLYPLCHIFGTELKECLQILRQMWTVLFPGEQHDIPAEQRYVDQFKPLNYHQMLAFHAPSSPPQSTAMWERLVHRLRADGARPGGN